MSWLAIILLVAIGFIIGGASTALLAGRCPDWRPRRRLVLAALVAPVLILLGTLVGVFMSARPSDGAYFDRLIVGALVNMGLQAAMIAFVSGLLAAYLADRALRS